MATYNSPTYPVASYNTPAVASYNSPAYPVASYNTPTYPIASYNAPTTGGTSSALGVSAAGGTAAPGSTTPATRIDTYAYPDNATYPVTVGSGGSVTIESK